MDFEDYLIRKKIDPAGFRSNELERYQEFQAIFEQVHPDSFTAQKLFLINKIRRQCPIKEADL